MTVVPPARQLSCRPGSVVSRRNPSARLHVHACASVGSSDAVNSTVSCVDAAHLMDLQTRWCDGFGADDQAPGVVVVDGPDELARARARRYAGHDDQPVRVGVLAQHRGVAGGHVDGQHAHHGLRPVLHHDQQPVLVPDGGDQVLERGAVPPDLDPPARPVDQPQAHVGVGGAGHRVLGGDGFAGGFVGIEQVPGLHGRVVDAGGRDARPVGRPPVAAHAAHRLRRDVLRQAPGDLRAVRLRQCPVAVPVDDAQRAAVDVGDGLTGRVETRVQRRGGRGHVARLTGRQVRHVDLAGDGEDGPPHVLVGRVRGDAPRPVAAPLALGPFGRRHRQVAVGERDRVGDQALLAGGDVQHPQAPHRIPPAPGAQEHHPLAVGADRRTAPVGRG